MKGVIIGLALFLIGLLTMASGLEPHNPFSLHHPLLSLIALASEFYTCLIVSILILAYKRKKEALLPLIGLLLAATITYLLKIYVNRLRPFGGEMSFPSGHSSSASSTFLPLIKRRTHLIIYIMFLIIVGADRILTGAHFPSDVIAGIGIGISSSSIVKLVFERSSSKPSPPYDDNVS